MKKKEYVKDKQNNIVFPVTHEDAVIDDNGITFKSKVNDALAEKQDNLISGENIRTINNMSILGGGNLIINSGGGSGQIMTSGTYADIKLLKEAGQLVPGGQYRITDYITTTTQEGTTSAGKPFDVIVTAVTNSTFGEDARAAIHEGDTYFTSAEANLSAWELKYCFDNDTTRFEWADSVNGKGVIYWMKDERNNECPYDFKNIQFSVTSKIMAHYYSEGQYDTELIRDSSADTNGLYAYRCSVKLYAGPQYVYTDDFITEINTQLKKNNGTNESRIAITQMVYYPPNGNKYTFTNGILDYSLNSNVYGNIIKPYYRTVSNITKQSLNKNVFLCSNSTTKICTNILESNTYNNILLDNSSSNHIGSGSNYNTLRGSNDNTLGTNCRGNDVTARYCTFGTNVSHISTGIRNKVLSSCIVENNVNCLFITGSSTNLQNMKFETGTGNSNYEWRTVTNDNTSYTYEFIYRGANSQILEI